MSNSMEFPLSIKRQYAEPLDADAYAETIAELDNIKTRSNSYAGMLVSCQEDGNVYKLGLDGEFVVLGSGTTNYKDIADLKADKQDKTDNSLDTTDKTVVGAINEINGNALDNVAFSADYKNIIINRKSGLNPYTIPISAIINNAKLTELNDVDSADIGNGKTLIYDSATQKHKYVDSTRTDELVKMDSTTDAKHLSELIDKNTIVNDGGVLKAKKLDGQEVTIAEINYLKGLTMNVMDLVNAFSNGGVKVLNTPLNTASELSTMDRSAFIDGISYIVYVLADENHARAKTTYLVDNTNTTFFGNADSQRNFTTDPIILANEVTGKLGVNNIDTDNLWKLLTIDDTYKTLTTTNNLFGTHGAKAMYDELVADIGTKANQSDFDTHKDDTTVHITQSEKNSYALKSEVLKEEKVKEIVDSEITTKGVCTTKVANVNKVKISLTGNTNYKTSDDCECFYMVKNGICFICLAIDCITPGSDIFICKAPAPPQVFRFSIARSEGSMHGYILRDGTLYLNGGVVGTKYFVTTFLYPVEEQ